MFGLSGSVLGKFLGVGHLGGGHGSFTGTMPSVGGFVPRTRCLCYLPFIPLGFLFRVMCVSNVASRDGRTTPYLLAHAGLVTGSWPDRVGSG